MKPALHIIRTECQPGDLVALVTPTEEWEVDSSGNPTNFTGVLAYNETEPQVSGYRCNGCERRFGAMAIGIAWQLAQEHVSPVSEVE